MRAEAVILAIASATPSRAALTDDEGSFSYEQLWAQAARVAGGLVEHGLPLGGAVAVMSRMSVAAVTTYLAVAIAGGHYVPIDPETPPPRVAAMTAAAGVVLLVRCGTDADLSEMAAIDFVALTAAEPIAPRSHTGADDALYVMFTSGSTGLPKPVAVSHRAVTASFSSTQTLMSVEPQDRVLARSSVAFDAATYEVWGALLVGAQLHFPPRAHIDLQDLTDLISRHGITAALLPSALFALITRDQASALASMRLLVVGGDVMPVGSARRLLIEAPGIELVNAYGPTEATVISTCYRVREWGATDHASVPIGRAYANTSTYVLDASLHPVPVGNVGDLWIGGPRLADGYVGDPSGTAARFMPDPFSGTAGSRMYSTGDRARQLPEGNLVFHGRLDREIKMSGFRVNLSEVDAILRTNPLVQDCASVAVGEAAQRSVVSFVVSQSLEPADVRAAALAVAPRHLVPEHVVIVDELPTTGAKVERRELERRAAQFDVAARPAQSALLPPKRVTASAVLSEAWERFAGAPPARGDDFFMSGGTSLGLMRLVTEIRTRAGVDVDFGELYSAEDYDEVLRIVRRSATAQEEHR